MKILVTGAKGFIGKNLVTELKNNGSHDIYAYDIDTDTSLLDVYCKDCAFVFNLAGINRPQKDEEFMEGNYEFVLSLLNKLEKYNNVSPIMNASSIQAELENPYGRSKAEGENLLFQYGRKHNIKIYNYRFPNVFGKWCRPNYNSVVATFCHNIANNFAISIHNPDTRIQLAYIDDVIGQLLAALIGEEQICPDGHCHITETYHIKLGEIAKLLDSFHEGRTLLDIPSVSSDSFSKKLYSTYLSYLPADRLSYPLKMNMDERGSFTETLRTEEKGQVSVNISKPGITKGNHWHHSKVEKFIVVYGNALIRLRKIGTHEVILYPVSGDQMQAVDIPPGYTHSIENTGDCDLVTIMWCNEIFNPDKSDTYFENVM